MAAHQLALCSLIKKIYFYTLNIVVRHLTDGMFTFWSHTILWKKLDWDPSSLDSIKQIVTEDLYMPEGISYAEHEIVKKRQMR